jgi:hypothetical protein
MKAPAAVQPATTSEKRFGAPPLPLENAIEVDEMTAAFDGSRVAVGVTIDP